MTHHGIPGNRGIPQALHSAIVQTLLQCDEFQSTARLRAVFAAEELRIWQPGLPEAESIRARVDLTIDFLREKRRTSGEHALVLLLAILAERYDPTDQRHEQLRQLAEQLRAVVMQSGPPATEAPQQAGSSASLSGRRRRLLQQHDMLQRELELRLAKMGRIREALAIETDVTRKFQLEQQQQSEALDLAKLEHELQALEQALQAER